MRVTPISILLLVSLAVGAWADTIPEAEHKSLQGFADSNASCREWTDGCAVCLRHDDKTFACSLPGIACEPTSLTCRTTETPDVTVPAK